MTQPSRRETVPITVHFPKAVRDQLKVLAAEQGRTMADMTAEAFDLLFEKYGKLPIAR